MQDHRRGDNRPVICEEHYNSLSSQPRRATEEAVRDLRSVKNTASVSAVSHTGPPWSHAGAARDLPSALEGRNGI